MPEKKKKSSPPPPPHKKKKKKKKQTNKSQRVIGGFVNRFVPKGKAITYCDADRGGREGEGKPNGYSRGPERRGGGERLEISFKTNISSSTKKKGDGKKPSHSGKKKRRRLCCLHVARFWRKKIKSRRGGDIIEIDKAGRTPLERKWKKKENTSPAPCIVWAGS